MPLKETVKELSVLDRYQRLLDFHEARGLEAREKLRQKIASATTSLNEVLKARENFGAVEKAVRDLQGLHEEKEVLEERLRKVSDGRKRHARELRRIGTADHLTGVGNDAALVNFIKGFQKKRKNKKFIDEDGFSKDEAELAVLHFDLGGLKAVNDQADLGHSYGNKLLKRSARLLEIVAGRFGVPVDRVFRHGGDEFSVVVTGKRAGAKAQRMADFLIRFHNRLMERDYSDTPFAPGKNGGKENGLLLAFPTEKHFQDRGSQVQHRTKTKPFFRGF